MTTIQLRMTTPALPTHRFTTRRFARLVCLACGSAVALLAASACTTTYRLSETRTVPRNTTPDSTSELHIADTALDSGNVELATTLYQKVAAADPRSVAALTGLGDTLYTVGDFTRAAVHYERALQVAPHATAPMIGLARVAIRQRRFDDAISIYRKVLALTPDAALASAGLGAALDLKGDHAAAQAVLRQALVAHPGDPGLSVNLGLSLTLGGDPRDGVNVLLDVTRYPGAPPQARQDLALAYGLLGNSEAAAAILGEDLPKASVQDNLRFYEIQRNRLAPPTTPTSKGSAAALNETTSGPSPSITAR